MIRILLTNQIYKKGTYEVTLKQAKQVLIQYSNACRTSRRIGVYRINIT